MRKLATFESWLAGTFPRALLAYQPHADLERLELHFAGDAVSAAWASTVIHMAAELAGWLVRATDWQRTAEGRVEVRSISFVRGAP